MLPGDCLCGESKGMQAVESGMGVVPILIEKEESADDLFEQSTRAVEDAGYVKKGDVAVLTAGVPLGVAGNTNMIRVIEV